MESEKRLREEMDDGKDRGIHDNPKHYRLDSGTLPRHKNKDYERKNYGKGDTLWRFAG